jgi:hypothetical protein
MPSYTVETWAGLPVGANPSIALQGCLNDWGKSGRLVQVVGPVQSGQLLLIFENDQVGQTGATTSNGD